MIVRKKLSAEQTIIVEYEGTHSLANHTILEHGVPEHDRISGSCYHVA